MSFSVVEKEVKDYVRRFPFNDMEFYEDRLVHRRRLMTSSEFTDAWRNLMRRREFYEPRAGYVETTDYIKTEPKNPRKMRQITQVKKEPKILKSKVKLVKRRVLEGYLCRSCGKWVKRSWAKRRLQKCPNCGKKTYYRKPVLQKQTMIKEKKTKFWKTLFEPVSGRLSKPIVRSRVGKPGITAAATPEPPPKPAVLKPKHMPRVEFKGSRKAHEATLKAWKTRRKQGWLGKGEVVRIIRNIESRKQAQRERQRLGHALIIAFRKNKRGRTYPITARVTKRKQAISARSHKLSVRPGLSSS